MNIIYKLSCALTKMHRYIQKQSHSQVVPGIGLDAFAGSAVAWLDAFSPDNFSLPVASIVSIDPFYRKL